MTLKQKLALTTKINFVISTSLYTIVYLIKTFIVWQWRNPFQWIIDIPIYTQETRGFILASIIMYYIIAVQLIFATIEDKEKK